MKRVGKEIIAILSVIPLSKHSAPAQKPTENAQLPQPRYPNPPVGVAVEHLSADVEPLNVAGNAGWALNQRLSGGLRLSVVVLRGSRSIGLNPVLVFRVQNGSVAF